MNPTSIMHQSVIPAPVTPRIRLEPAASRAALCLTEIHSIISDQVDKGGKSGLKCRSGAVTLMKSHNSAQLATHRTAVVQSLCCTIQINQRHQHRVLWDGPAPGK